MVAEQLDLFARDPIADLAAQLGVTIHDSLGPEGGRCAVWPGEDLALMLGMVDEDLLDWLTRELDWRAR